MPKFGIGKLVLFLGGLLILSLSACNSVLPVPVPSVTPGPQRQPNVDMKPILRDFLANLPADWNLVSVQSVVAASPFIVDVRQPEDYARGFIAGAINLPLRELARSLSALPGLDQDIVLVDETGHRAAIGMAILQMLGYRKAKTLEGGIRAWQAAKQSVVTAPVPQRPTGQTPVVNAQVQTMLDYYLVHTLPIDWGMMDATALTADQKLSPSSAGEAMPETYDQGASLIIDLDLPAEFEQSSIANFNRALNIPLRQLPDKLDQMPLQETIDWA